MSRGPAPGIELVWPGKYDAEGRRVRVPRRACTFEAREIHGPDGGGRPDELVRGDNLDVLDRWLETRAGTVDLVVIDPPFSTGSRFDVQTRVGEGDAVVSAPAYGDRWPGGTAAFLAMLAPRIERMHALLAPHGSLYVHVDPTVGHAVKLLVDEVFGEHAFQREIVWRIGWVSGFKTRARNWIRNHDLIYFWAKDPARMRFEKVYVPHPPGYARRAGAPAKAPGIAIDDVWNAGPADLALVGRESLDSIQIKSFSQEKTGYATQKNEALLRRILSASSRPGDWVADPFCGSGTTLAVATAMGRRVLGCDCGRAAFSIARARLVAMPRETPLVVGALVPAKRSVRARVLARWGAPAIAKGGELHGAIDRAAVHVGETIDRAGLERLASLASAAGHRGLHAITTDVALALDVTTKGVVSAPKRWAKGIDVVLAVLDGDALAEGDDEREHVLPERPAPTLVIAGLSTTRPSIELRDLRMPHADLWPADLRAHAGLALVESVAIAWETASTLRFTEIRTRTPTKRALDLRFVAPASLPRRSTATLQIIDVRRIETRIELALTRSRSGWTLESATQR